MPYVLLHWWLTLKPPQPSLDSFVLGVPGPGQAAEPALRSRGQREQQGLRHHLLGLLPLQPQAQRRRRQEEEAAQEAREEPGGRPFQRSRQERQDARGAADLARPLGGKFKLGPEGGDRFGSGSCDTCYLRDPWLIGDSI